MKRELGDYIEDIIDAMKKAGDFIKGMDYEAFSQDDKTIFAVIRSIEIIGEAAKKIPEKVRKKYPAVPWKDLAGMRDKVIHEYFGVKLNLVWNAAANEVQSLIPLFEKVLEDMDREAET